jgi:hypothetical protein
VCITKRSARITAQRKQSLIIVMSDSVQARVEAFKRNLLEQALNQCTKEQQTFFHRLYPSGVPEESLVSAIELCERTIIKNHKKV